MRVSVQLGTVYPNSSERSLPPLSLDFPTSEIHMHGLKLSRCEQISCITFPTMAAGISWEIVSQKRQYDENRHAK